MKEVWKDIKGYEGSYQISNTGKVRGLDRVIICTDGRARTIKGCIKKQGTKYDGYRYVHLWENRRSKYQLIHRIVALHFIPNPENKPQINHIDGDKTNNNVTNLEWVTVKENIHHAIKMGLRSDFKGKNNPFYGTNQAVKLRKKVINTATGELFDSIADAAKHHGCHQSHMVRMLNGQKTNNTTYRLLKTLDKCRMHSKRN